MRFHSYEQDFTATNKLLQLVLLGDRRLCSYGRRQVEGDICVDALFFIPFTRARAHARLQRTPREGLTDLMQLPLRTEIFDNGAYKVRA